MSVVERNFIGIIRKPINGLLHYKQLYWKKKRFAVSDRSASEMKTGAVATKAYIRNFIPSPTDSTNDHEAESVIMRVFNCRGSRKFPWTVPLTLPSLVGRSSSDAY
jgi:hypothetical protein